MDQYQHARRVNSRAGFLIATLAAGTWLLASPAGADESGPTVTGQICMQKVFGTPVSPSNRVNCTANDIRLSRAISVNPTTCFTGTTIPVLEATFETIVTSNARYDAGYFFRTDGGPNARGDGVSATGQCSLSALTPGEDPALNLDGDSCGDLNAGTYLVTFSIPNVVCQAAPGTNHLRLPNCTSWHSNQATQCDISNPFNTDDAFDFHPDTKAKCVCDDDFTVPVIVADAEIIVTKTAIPTSVPESGGSPVFTVLIENAAENEAVTISSIIDIPFGNLGTNSMGFAVNDCPDLIGVTLGPGDSESCMFSALVMGNSGTTHTDTVTVTAIRESNGENVSDDDDAIVTFTDVSSVPSVSKTAQATANCELDATYQVVVSNNSDPDAEADTLDVNSLNDDKFGDITTVHPADSSFAEVVSTTCNSVANPFDTIDPAGSYTCSFVGRIVSSDCDFSHTNTVTADVTDDDGVNSTPTDDAMVSVDATP